MHRSKPDENTSRIVDALRKVGAVVWFIQGAHGQAGVPDLLVGYRGRTYLMEVKMPKGKVSDAQTRFFETWQGATAAIVRDEKDALETVGLFGVWP